MPRARPRRDLRPYRGKAPAPTIGSMLALDVGSVLLVVAGLSLAIALAILAGRVSARVFFAASRQHIDPPPSPPLSRP